MIEQSAAPTTTAQQDLTTAGQRLINEMWETTQKWIALVVIIGTVVIDGMVVMVCLIMSKDLTAAQALTLGFVNSTANGVISFYFSRTNHTNIGGIGPKPNPPHEGR